MRGKYNDDVKYDKIEAFYTKKTLSTKLNDSKSQFAVKFILLFKLINLNSDDSIYDHSYWNLVDDQ